MRPLARRAILAAVLLAAACGRGEVDEADDIEQIDPAADTASAGGAPDTAAGEGVATASGQAVFSANCATCHGDTGRGDGPAAVGLEPPPADLSDGAWVTGDGSLAAIRNVIENGSPGTAMIGWKGTLSDAEIASVAQFVQSLSR